MRRVAAATALIAVIMGVAWVALRPPADTSTEDADPAHQTDVVPEQDEPQRRRAANRAATGALSIVGSVTRAGAPASARIDVTPLGDVPPPSAGRPGFPLERLLLVTVGDFVATPPIATADTDRDGRFACAGLTPGLHRVTATGVDRARASTIVALTADASPQPVALTLPGSGPVLTGRVLRHDGAPFVGQVAPAHGDFERALYRSPDDLLALPWRRTGADGGFAFESVEGDVRVAVLDPGRLLALSPPVTTPRPEPFEFRLPDPKQGVRGRVVEAGRVIGIRGADVLALASAPHLLRDGAVYLARAQSDADGRFDLAVGAPTTLVAHAPGFGPGLVRVLDGANEIAIELVPLGRVHGRVLDAESGAPVEGVLVHARAVEGDKLGTIPVPTRSAADGTFELNGLPAGSRTVFALGGGWASVALATISDDGADPLSVTLEPGGGTSIDLRVEPSGALLVRVFDSTGDPLSGAGLALHGARGFAALQTLPGRIMTRERGEARIADVVPGAAYQLLVAHEGHTPTRSATVHATSGETASVEVRLTSERTLRVRVVDADDDSPIAGATVTLTHHPTDVAASALSLADGQAHLTPAPEGSATLGASRTGYVEVRQKVETPPGIGTDPPVIELRMTRGLALAGTVIAPDGVPLSGAFVQAEVDMHALVIRGDVDMALLTRHELPIACDSDGRFAFEGLPAAPFEVSVRHSWDGRTFVGTAKAESGVDDVEVRLTEETVGELTITLSDAAGRPIPRADYLVRGPSRSGSIGGGYRIYDPPKGDEVHVVVVSRARDGADRPLPLGGVIRAIRERDGTKIELRLPPERVITGRAVDDEGRPVRGVRLRAYPHDQLLEDLSMHVTNYEPWGEALTDGDGRFRLGQLGDGEFDVYVQLPVGFVAVGPFRWESGTDDIALTLSRGTPASVTVLDDAGEPIADAFVEARIGRKRVEARSGHDGIARLEGLAPDASYTLRVKTGSDARSPAFPYEKEAWLPADVEVRLERAFEIVGTVRDENGTAIPRAMVERRHGSGHSGRGADALGRFGITGLHAGDLVFLRARAPTRESLIDVRVGSMRPAPPGSADGDAGWTQLRAGERDAVLTLDPGARLRVRVADWTDALRGTHFVLRDAAGGRGVLSNGELPSQGVIEFVGLADTDQLRLFVGPTADGRYGVLEAPPSGETEHRIALIQGEPLEGRVVAPDGVAVGDLLVRADGEGVYGRTRTDAEGRFHFPGLPPGEYRIAASVRRPEGVLRGAVDARTMESRVELVIRDQ